jgi:hypothetical protein
MYGSLHEVVTSIQLGLISSWQFKLFPSISQLSDEMCLNLHCPVFYILLNFKFKIPLN